MMWDIIKDKWTLLLILLVVIVAYIGGKEEIKEPRWCPCTDSHLCLKR